MGPIDYSEVRKAALVFGAINHSLRQKIINLIQEERKIHVMKIVAKLRLGQSVTSLHLAILRRSGFITGLRDGKFIYYSVNKDRMNKISRLIDEINKW